MDAASRSAGKRSGVSIGSAFYIAIAEWHVTPEYVLDNWTDEFFDLMFEKRNEALRIMNDPTEQTFKPKLVSDADFFAQMGVKPQVVRTH